MSRVVAIILHPVAGPDRGPLESILAEARRVDAQRQERGFAAAGAETEVVEVEAGGAPFGARLRSAAGRNSGAGLVVLGAGSIPLATDRDRAMFVRAAGSPGGPVLVNNAYSADILAIPATVDLRDLPDLTGDNAVPRWLAERGVPVTDRATQRRLQVDIDSPLDAWLVGLVSSPADAFARVHQRVEAIRSVARDPARQLVVAGRTSSRTLRWLERRTASRTRALVEERGMRTASPGQPAPRSTLGLLLDRDGPDALGRLLAELGDAAVVDTRVLIAHRVGPDERRWPVPEDRFASDLLLADRIGDPWLRDVAAAASEAPIPALLGGHTLVGPGLPLLLGGRRRRGIR